MTSTLVLKVILLTLDLVTLQIKKHDKASYDKRINAIKANPSAAFKSKFSRMRHTDKNDVSSSSPHSKPGRNSGRDSNK